MSFKIPLFAALVLLLPLSSLYADRDRRSAPEKRVSLPESDPNVQVKEERVSLPELDPNVQAEVDTLFAGLKGDPPISTEDVTDGLLRLGPSAIPCLPKHLNKDTNKTTADIVANVLEELKDENTVTQLAVLLESDSEDTALGAARALGLIGTPEAVAALSEVVMTTMNDNLFVVCSEAILSVLRRGSAAAGSFFTIANLAEAAEPSERERLIRCLGASGSKEAVRFLLDFLRDEKTSVKAAALNALGRLGVGDSRACSKVRRYMRGRDINLKKQAVTTLGLLKDWESVPYLIDLLENDNSSVARSAHWALQNITGLKFPLSHNRWISWWNREDEKYENRMDPLIDRLYEGTVQQRIYAIRELSGIALGRGDVVGAVLGFTNDEDAQIRKEACTALGTMKSTEAVPYLIDSLDDSDEGVRAVAHKALHKITGENLPLERVAWKDWESATSKER